MFCVVYEFTVKPGKNEAFEKSWAEFTEAIYRVRGSLGSRLHISHEPNKYMAYAQWPSEETFNDIPGDEKYSLDELNAREEMRNSVLETKTIYKMHILKNHLREASTAPAKPCTKNL